VRSRAVLKSRAFPAIRGLLRVSNGHKCLIPNGLFR
jgi:hypothetical protein